MKIVYLISKKIKTYICIVVSLLVFSILFIINVNYFQVYHTLQTNISDNEQSNPTDKYGSRLAIVIEDFDYNKDGADEMMSIKRHLTFSVGAFESETATGSSIFIDGKGKSKEYIKNKLKAAAVIAQSDGAAIAVGHIGEDGGKLTFQAIKEMLDYFDSNKIQLVFISELEN